MFLSNTFELAHLFCFVHSHSRRKINYWQQVDKHILYCWVFIGLALAKWHFWKAAIVSLYSILGWHGFAEYLFLPLALLLAPSGALIAIPTYYWSPAAPHFFRSHRSSTLDFHFLSHNSYIKAIMLYKGNHWTHLLTTCIPYGYNRISLQDSAR